MTAPKKTIRCSVDGCNLVATGQSPYDGEYYCWRHLYPIEGILA